MEDKRQGREHFKKFDMAAYARMNFGMYGGEEVTVKLQFQNDMVGVLIDSFGKSIPINPSVIDGWSETHVKVALSDQFLGWIFSLGTSVRITGPEEVVERLKQEISILNEMYQKNI